MSDPPVECVVAAGARLGESPVWSPADERLYWVDIHGYAIHRTDPSSGTDETFQLPGRPASFGLTARSGRLFLAIETQVAWFDWHTRRLELVAQLEAAGTGNRLNDGRVDPAGRFWVGSMHTPPTDRVSCGLLHLVDLDGRRTVEREGIGVTNGLAFAPDGRTMYFADTPRRTVWAYAYDPDSGRRSDERVFFEYRNLAGAPDGGCVDADGCYWSACVYGGALIRITPDGRLDRRIPLPVERPTKCAFGGAELDVLYVTSMGGGPGTLAGGIHALDVSVTGLPEPVVAIAGAERVEDPHG